MIRKLEFITKEKIVLLKVPDLQEDRDKLVRKLTEWMKRFLGEEDSNGEETKD